MGVSYLRSQEVIWAQPYEIWSTGLVCITVRVCNSRNVAICRKWAKNGGLGGKWPPKPFLMWFCTLKAITFHGTTLFEPLMTKMWCAVWAVGSLMKKRKKNPETLENAWTLNPYHDPPFNANTTKMIWGGHMVDVSNPTNFDVNPLIGVRSLGTWIFGLPLWNANGL